MAKIASFLDDPAVVLHPWMQIMLLGLAATCVVAGGWTLVDRKPLPTVSTYTVDRLSTVTYHIKNPDGSFMDSSTVVHTVKQ